MPLNLEPVQSGYNLSVINDNFQRIEDTWDEKLDRLTSTQNNYMEQELDMNSNHIINHPAPRTETDLVRLKELEQLVIDSDVVGVIPLQQPRQVGDGVTTSFAAPNTKDVSPVTMMVRIDGVMQRAFTDFEVEGAGTIRFTEAPPLNSDIDITYFEPNVTENPDVSLRTAKSTGSTTSRTLADRFADVTNVKDFGAVGDGVTDDTAAIQAAIAASEGVVFLPQGNYVLSEDLVITKSMNLVGSGMTISEDSGTRLTFTNGSGMVLESGIYAGSVTDMALRGSGAGTGLSINPSATPAGITNHNYKNLRIEGFALGMQTFFTWTNTFDNIRINGCTQGFVFGAQTNSSTFLNFSATNCTVGSRFVNVEGLHFDCANISNQSGNYAISLAQSYVTMNSPYFENVPPTFILLGSSSEVNPSTLVINGGIMNNDIEIAGARAQLFINGTRTSANGTKIKSNGEVPRILPANIYVEFAELGDGTNATLRKDAVLDVYYDKPVLFPGASGGSIRFVDYYRDHYTMEQQAALNGIELANNLVVDDQYTLVIMARKVGSIPVSMRMGSVNLSILESIIPESTEDWFLATIPFVATDSVLDLLYTGVLEIKKLAIYKGLVNTNTFDLPEPTVYSLDKEPTTVGWEDGDTVLNSAPSVGEPIGWVYNGGWLAMPNYV